MQPPAPETILSESAHTVLVCLTASVGCSASARCVTQWRVAAQTKLGKIRGRSHRPRGFLHATGAATRNQRLRTGSPPHSSTCCELTSNLPLFVRQKNRLPQLQKMFVLPHGWCCSSKFADKFAFCINVHFIARGTFVALIKTYFHFFMTTVHFGILIVSNFGAIICSTSYYYAIYWHKRQLLAFVPNCRMCAKMEEKKDSWMTEQQ